MVQKLIKIFFIGLAAFSTASICANLDTLTTSHNFFQPRSFSANLAREMLMEGSKHKDSNSWYGQFSATGVYQRSWGQSMKTTVNNKLINTTNGLGAYPFWSGTNTMSLGANVGGANLDVYQFGIGPIVTAGGSLTLNPIVYQAGADFMLIMESSAHESSFFTKIKAPVGVYNINPQLTEIATVVSPASYYAGQIALDTVTTYQPAGTMTQAFAGNLPGGQLSGQGNFIPMKYGLINGEISTGATFGDIEITTGYRFISDNDDIFSIALRASAPTGNKAQGIYMLEPIFGRGGNWGLGGYVDAHVNVWEGNNENSVQLKFIANALHLFNTDTVRSYDLIANGSGSKYLLVGSFPSGVYQNKIANLINYTTLDSTSTFAIEGDAALALTYCTRGWSFDLGYEFWGRSAETLKITGDFVNASYAVLGRQYVETTTPGQAANYCQPFAKINLSTSNGQQTTPNVTTDIATTQTQIVNAALAGNRIALADLNVAGAQQNTTSTSKIFTKATYQWMDCDYCPHLGIMSECEFSTSNNNALPQWSIALIAGTSF
jgi:hypothetical protein